MAAGLCEYADLFESCTAPAAFIVQWRQWGRIQYCRSHFRHLTHGQPSDLVRWASVKKD